MHSFRTVDWVERLPAELGALSREARDYLENGLDEPLTEASRGKNSGNHGARRLPPPWTHMTRKSAIRVAALFHDIGKADRREGSGGSITFHDQEYDGAELWKDLAERFGVVASVRVQVTEIISGHMHLMSLYGNFVDGKLAEKAVDRLVRRYRDVLPELLLLFLADSMAGEAADQDDTLCQFVMHVQTRSAILQAEEEQDSHTADRPTAQQLKDAGLTPNKWFGIALQHAQRAADERPELSDTQLIELARHVYQEERTFSGGEVQKLVDTPPNSLRHP